MTPEQRAVLHGHEKRLAYRMDKPNGTQLVYECKSLGFREIQLYPKRRQTDVTCPPIRRYWQFDGSEITYHNLAEVANVLLRSGVHQKKEKANV